MNHTHYLFMDDGRLKYHGVGDYRTQLVDFVSHNLSNNSYPSSFARCLSLKSICSSVFIEVPSVTILFEGGEDSIRSIYNDLRRNIPIVIVNVRCIRDSFSSTEDSI